MKPYTLRGLLLILVCLVLSFALTSCEDLFGGETGESSSNEEQDKAETEDETGDRGDVPFSPGAPLPGGSLQEKFSAVSQRTDDRDVIYDIAVETDGTYNPMTVKTGGKHMAVKLHSNPPYIHTLTLGASGSLLAVGDNTTLILENIVIQGQPGNNRALITVESGGTLTILDGAVIRGNENKAETQTYYSGEGGGVYVGGKAGLFMKGGEICYNSRTHYSDQLGDGGGVALDKESYFNMTGGSIHHNEADRYGGGVAVFDGIFLMNGGEIAGNKAWYGGGVYVRSSFGTRFDPLFKKEPLPGELKSGIIWGYPANDDKENYANGPTVWYDWYEGYYSYYRESTLGEYHAISTERIWGDGGAGGPLIPDSGWEKRN
ncbi:MAG: hypothetical protein LBD37_10340 [Treponema sp.]|nr:hypothetical protein [Treponema sp.]